MFGIAPSEFMLLAVVALLVIGPKDLPRAMRFAGHWVGKARGMTRHVHAGFEAVIREAELAEVRKQANEISATIMTDVPGQLLKPLNSTGSETSDANRIVAPTPG